MKYALSCMVRLSNKEERDRLFNEIKTLAGNLELGDSFIQKHICYHDENPAKPCKIEEHITSDNPFL